MTSCTLALTLPFLVAGAPLLSIIFGEEFGDASSSLLVLCSSVVINGFFGANAALLNMTGHHARVTRASGVSLVLFALAAPILIGVQGTIGAAIATALSMLTWSFLMWRDAQRLLALDTSFMSFFKSQKSHV